MLRNISKVGIPKSTVLGIIIKVLIWPLPLINVGPQIIIHLKFIEMVSKKIRDRLLQARWSMKLLCYPLILSRHPRDREIAVTRSNSKWKNFVYILKYRIIIFSRIGQKTWLFNETIKRHAQPCSGHNISPTNQVWNGTRWSSWLLHFFEIGYCGIPVFPFAYIQLEQNSKLILSHF